MKRIIVTIFLTTTLTYYPFAREFSNSLDTQSWDKTNLNSQISRNTFVFEETIVGSLITKTLPLTVTDVRKHTKRRNLSTMFDYLQDIPDTLTPNYYGADGSLTAIFTPRGEKVNLAINGLDVSTIVNSTYDASILDPFFFSSVEIYYGPSSARYGSGNYGGVVNFTLAEEKNNKASILLGIGSFGTYYSAGEITTTSEIGKFYIGATYSRHNNIFTFNLSHLYTNFSQLEPTNYVREKAEHSKYSLMARYVSEISSVRIDSGVLVTFPEVNEPNSILPHNPLDHEKATSKTRFLLPYLKLSYAHNDGETGLKIYYTEHLRNREVERVRLSPWGSSIGSKIYGNKVSLEIETKHQVNLLPKHFVFLGASISYSANFCETINSNLLTFPTTNTNESGTNITRNIIGAYIEGNYYVSPLLNLMLSGRIDYIDTSQIEFSPRAGIMVKLLESIGIRSSVWRAYRLPYFDDVFGPIVYGYGTSPLTNLKTEYITGVDLTFSFEHEIQNHKFLLSVTPYYSDATNLIAWNPSTFSTENIGKVYTRGANVLLKFEYNKNLKSLVSYTYTEPINVNSSESAGKIIFLNYRPLNSLHIDLMYEEDTLGIKTHLTYYWNRFEYTFDSNFNVAGNRPLDDIMSISCKVWTKPSPGTEVGVEIKRHLIGNEYVEGYPLPEERITFYTIISHEW